MNTAGLFNSDAAAIYVLLVVIAVIVLEVAWTVLTILCLDKAAEQFRANRPKRIQRHLDTLGDAGKTLAQRLFLI